MSEIKNSKVDWIGFIPSDWSVLRIKNCCKLNGRIGWQGLKSDEFIESGPYLITGTDFEKGTINWSTCVRVSEERFAEAPEIHVKNGDLLITKDGTVGKVAIAEKAPEKVSLNSGVLLIRVSKNIDVQYLYFVLMSDLFWAWFKITHAGSSTILHLYQNKFYDFSFPIPKTLVQQRKIASYLNQKCSAIDSSIEKIQKHTELLEEYKKSVIIEAVTKGLDSNAPMKNSGVEWIGNIPQKWQIIKLKYVCDIKTGDKDTVDRDDDGKYPFFVRSPVIERINSYSFEGEAILTAGDGVGAGKVFHHYVGKFDYHQRVYNLYNFKFITGKYLYFYLLANFYKEVEKGSAKSTVDSIRLPMLTNFPICIPDNCQAITQYLDHKCSDINAIMEAEKDMIKFLKDYKESLIFEHVTGKRRVEVET